MARALSAAISECNARDSVCSHWSSTLYKGGGRTSAHLVVSRVLFVKIVSLYSAFRQCVRRSVAKVCIHECGLIFRLPHAADESGAEAIRSLLVAGENAIPCPRSPLHLYRSRKTSSAQTAGGLLLTADTIRLAFSAAESEQLTPTP